MGETDQNWLHLKRCSDSILTWQHSDGHFIVDPVNEQKMFWLKLGIRVLGKVFLLL